MKIVLPTATFQLPRNFLAPGNSKEPNEKRLDGFGFTMFLPNYEGFSDATADAYWRPYLYRGEIISIVKISNPDRAILQKGERVNLPPSAWGDVDALFKLFAASLPHVYDLNDLSHSLSASNQQDHS